MPEPLSKTIDKQQSNKGSVSDSKHSNNPITNTENTPKSSTINTPLNKETQTLSAQVFDTLKTEIIEGRIEQGSKITEDGLAKQFGVSRGPLREALRQLESARLIVRIPHAGVRVVTLSQDLMQDIYTIREALEGMSARLAAENMNENTVGELWALLDDHETDIKNHGGTRYFQSEGNLDFHYKIAASSNNQWLIDLLSSELYQLLRMSRRQSGQIPNRPMTALNEHRQIVQAIENRDAELAELLMRRHISRAWLELKEYLKKSD